MMKKMLALAGPFSSAVLAVVGPFSPIHWFQYNILQVIASTCISCTVLVVLY
jgi:hypothetical protein